MSTLDNPRGLKRTGGGFVLEKVEKDRMKYMGKIKSKVKGMMGMGSKSKSFGGDFGGRPPNSARAISAK